jgi:glycine cleavage system pyridoxal-binding protein P
VSVDPAVSQLTSSLCRREQHIRREKATQHLRASSPAVIVVCGVYHGPDGPSAYRAPGIAPLEHQGLTA